MTKIWAVPLVLASVLPLLVPASGAGAAAGRSGCVAVPALSASAKQTLASDANAIERQLTVTRDGSRMESWTDPVHNQVRNVSRGPGGKIHSEYVVDSTRWLLVNYDNRTWVNLARPSSSFAATTAQALATRDRDDLANSRVKLVGRTEVDGVPALHVRRLETVPSPGPTRISVPVPKQLRSKLPKGLKLSTLLKFPKLPPTRVRTESWLDAETFLPLRVRTYVNRRYLGTESDTWLPRTAANLARTKLVIPAGFRRETSLRSGNLFSLSSGPKPEHCHA